MFYPPSPWLLWLTSSLQVTASMFFLYYKTHKKNLKKKKKKKKNEFFFFFLNNFFFNLKKKLMINSFIQPYRTRPPASCDTAGFSQIPGRIPFLQGGELILYTCHFIHVKYHTYFLKMCLTSDSINMKITVAKIFCLKLSFRILFIIGRYNHNGNT